MVVAVVVATAAAFFSSPPSVCCCTYSVGVLASVRMLVLTRFFLRGFYCRFLSFLFGAIRQMLVINRTPNTLTNLTVELSTMGDLRLVERPQSHTIGPLDSRNIRANIKVLVFFVFP